MPDVTSYESPDTSQWQNLPAFYSPQPRPSSSVPPPSDLDLNPENASHPPSALPPYLHNDTLASSRASTPDGSVPPSLLSPAFTPPSTPGSAVPVDAKPRTEHTVKRPRLLETLPEVSCVVRARIPTTTGTEMFLHLYTNSVDNKEHLAIVFGPHIRSRSLDVPRPGETEMSRMIRGAYTGRLYPGRISSSLPTSASPLSVTDTHANNDHATTPPLVRIHSECYTGETAWSARCDCGEQLDEAARLMSIDPDGGAIVYLRQEGRGIGLQEKLKAYNLQDLGSDTVEANLLLRHPADARSYGLATAILVDLGLTEVRLLTNNPEKVRAVEGPGREVQVKERVPMVPIAWRTGGKQGVSGAEIGGYLRTKIEKMGHMLEMS